MNSSYLPLQDMYNDYQNGIVVACKVEVLDTHLECHEYKCYISRCYDIFDISVYYLNGWYH